MSAKISICGKGGSGKSTITAMMAKRLSSMGKRVLVIDCDESNYGLHQQLGIEAPESFVNNFGGKMAVMKMLENGPQNMPPLFGRRWGFGDIPEKFRTEKDGIMLMSPGKIEGANEACACPFVAVIAQFLNVLQLEKDDVVLLDMEAGIEHFGRGVENSVDGVVMVVDPSLESVKLSSKVARICDSIGKPSMIVLNKVDSVTESMIRGKIEVADRIIGTLHLDNGILESGLTGEPIAFNKEIEDIVDKVSATVSA